MSGVSRQHRPDGTFYTQPQAHTQRHCSQTTLITYTCKPRHGHSAKNALMRKCHIFSNSILLGSDVTPTYLTHRSPSYTCIHKYTSVASSFFTVSWCKCLQLTFSERLCICLFRLGDSNIAQDAVVVAKGSLTHCPSSWHFCNTHIHTHTLSATPLWLTALLMLRPTASGITQEANSNPLPPLSGNTHLHIARHCPKENTIAHTCSPPIDASSYSHTIAFMPLYLVLPGMFYICAPETLISVYVMWCSSAQ